MSAELVAGLSLFVFVSSITPGPNNIMLLTSGANHGVRRTLPHLAGVTFGFAFLILVAGGGMGAVFATLPRLQDALKAASAAYILWLAWKIANAGPIHAGNGDGRGRPMTFLEAAAFQWVNPKAWAMGLAIIAAYTNPDRQVESLLIASLVSGLVNAPCVSVWTLFGAALRGMLQRPAAARLFNRVMAVLLVASLVPLLI